jgi:hypothetical protein
MVMSWDNHHKREKHEIKLMMVGGRNKIMPRQIPTRMLSPSLNRVVIK